MIPPKSHPRYRQLVTGEFTHPFKAFAGSMCVSQNLRSVKNSGGSPESIEAAVNDVYAFFVRFESTLVDDIKAIFG